MGRAAATDDIDVVLFDLGGVLMRVSGVDRMRTLADLGSDDEVWTRWLTCEWVRAFETGGCSIEAFVEGVVTDWKLSATPEEFLEVFRSFPTGLFDGAEALVVETASAATVGCLSNSNALHWDVQTAWGLGSWFEHSFLSHELGLIKPDRAVFDHVVKTLDVPADRIVFLDDNILNVDGATAVGLVARHVRGVDEARAALHELGIIDRTERS